MADRPLPAPLPADLPEDWTEGQIVAPEGADAGLTEQHGYNYLMAQVNAAQRAANAINESFDTISGKRTCRFVVGTSTAGWTQADCDYLCDGTDDHVEINAALAALEEYGGGEIVVLAGEYDLAASVRLSNGAGNVTIIGTPGATVLNLAADINGMPLMVGEKIDIFFWGLAFKAATARKLVTRGAVSIQNCTFLNVLIYAQDPIGAYSGDEHFGLEVDSCRFELTSDQGSNMLLYAAYTGDEKQIVSITRNQFEISRPAVDNTRQLISLTAKSRGVFADNVVSCLHPNWSISANGEFLVTGNDFAGVGVFIGRGGSVSGNQMKGGCIFADAVGYSGDTQEDVNGRMVSVTGNSLADGYIYALGGVEVSGNVVNAPADKAAVLVRKDMPGIGSDIGPSIVGNFIAGGSIGIHLTKADTLDAPYAEAARALIVGNRIRDCETSIQIEENWSNCLVANNLFDWNVVDYGTDNTIHLNNDDTIDSGGGAAAGVSSFNGRSGAVAPKTGDYTAAMVGAVASGAVQTVQVVTQEEYDALTTKDAGTLYLIKE